MVLNEKFREREGEKVNRRMDEEKKLKFILIFILKIKIISFLILTNHM